MVMDVAAQPVAELARVVGEGVDGAVLVEQRERPVHGGEADARTPTTQPVVQLARGDVVVLAGQLLGDQDSLGRHTDAVPGEKVDCLIPRAHVV
jgi:hypothetical protein